MLKVNDCTFSYSRRKEPVLKDFSLEISEGGVYGLLGSNGAGKSTLLYLISGLLTPDSGDVTLNGINTRLRQPETVSEIFIVPEEFDFPSLSLNRFVEINRPFYPNFSYEEMIENLALFELTPEINVSKLSMGQKKKVALSFAMATNTKVLILDEPTNGLDIPGKTAFRRYISRAVDENRIFIISTHQVRDVAQLLDHILIIDNRQVLFNHTVGEIQSRLKFVETLDRKLIDSAFYASNSLMGSSLILPNLDGNDTEINLELLFEFAHNDPQALNSIFSNK
ncbi:MAG: ATP-binding cassette domain-containing protein [Muribaculaceae bacterium]|nr:ATP-binding cassette domain-containing protein [Muribaculaceae bacterium]MDE6028475.1 ATP-binding cassette domain-containing protein [Muribaculaceae bacterium]